MPISMPGISLLIFEESDTFCQLHNNNIGYRIFIPTFQLIGSHYFFHLTLVQNIPLCLDAQYKFSLI